MIITQPRKNKKLQKEQKKTAPEMRAWLTGITRNSKTAACCDHKLSCLNCFKIPNKNIPARKNNIKVTTVM